ncbi:hypothetical protein CHUAL_003836 [Chamberlinius hualienensis]
MALKENLLYGIEAITSFIFILIISPKLFGVYFLFWLWSKFVSHFLVINCSKLDGDDVMAGLNNCQHSTIMNVIVILEGKFTVEKMQQLFISRIIKAKDENNEPLLPKFTQYMVQHYDYWFWKPKTNFEINENIFQKEPIQSEKDLKKVVNEIINQAIPFSKPLWEIAVMPYLIPGSEPRTVCLFRIHHAICDGVTFLRIIMLLAENDVGLKMIMENTISKRQAKVKANFKQKLTKIVQNIYRFTLAPMFLLRVFIIRDKPFISSSKLTNVLISDWTTNIKLQTIKDIKNNTSTTVNDVITSCVAGALRRSFLRKNTVPPKSVNVIVPVSLQGLNDKLANSNNISFMLPRFQTGDMDCITRLKKTKIMMDEIKTSPEIVINRLVFKFFGSFLPNSLMKICSTHSPAAQTRSTASVGVIALSVGKTVNFGITLDAIYTSNPNDATIMLKEIEAEIDHLYNVVTKVKPPN